MLLLDSILQKNLRWCCVLLVGLSAGSAVATPDLTIRAENVVVSYGDTTGLLGVYLTNPVDTVVGYQFWLQLDRPDLVLFDDSLNTEGSLSAGWDLVHARSVSGTYTELIVVGLADDITAPGAGQPVVPLAAERLLVRIPFKVLTVPDTMTERTALVHFVTQPSYLGFSRPNGTLIGLSMLEIADTACWHCYNWQGTVCLDWRRVLGPPCDSTAITLDSINILDSLKLVAIPGSITVATCERFINTIDINADGMPMTISDLVALLRYIVGDTADIGNPSAADINGDCLINWADAYLLDSLYSLPYNPPPEIWPRVPCPCEHPVRVCCWQMRGNLNGDSQQLVDLSDLSTMVGYLTGGGPVTLKCFDEANVDGKGIVDLADLSRLVAYLVGAGVSPAQCP